MPHPFLSAQWMDAVKAIREKYAAEASKVSSSIKMNLVVTDSPMAVNYGLNKVRFPAPVPVGTRIRLSATLQDVEEVSGGLQVTVAAVIEAEGVAKPVCISEPVFRIYGG